MSTRSELESIKYELRLIIRELDSIAYEIDSRFQGIGQEKCANCIKRDAERYRKALFKLEKVNPSLIKEGFDKIIEGV